MNWVAVLCGLWTAVVLIQSGLDKVLDFRGNLAWLEQHFAQTILRKFVKPMLIQVTALELVAGLACLVGAFWAVVTAVSRSLMGSPAMTVLAWGCLLGAINYLMLMFGQRVAKDYAGAAVLNGYFLVAVFGLMAAAANSQNPLFMP